MSQKLFVTGGTGVLGRAVVPRLVAAGHDVVAAARSPQKSAQLRSQGASGVTVDLFHPDAVASAVEGRDAVLHLATHIPTGAGAATRRGWRTNDALRRDASRVLATAAIDAGVSRYVGESITFTYPDRGDQWIDESVPLECVPTNATVLDAEAAAARVDDAGGVGVMLRFAMFWATDSAHIEMFRRAGRTGLFMLVGAPDAYASFIHIDDAAAAVVAALDAPSGTYNIAEGAPERRSAHAEALAAAVGRGRLRHVPSALVATGGEAAKSIARSQRVSSATFQAATGWEPHIAVVTQWGERS